MPIDSYSLVRTASRSRPPWLESMAMRGEQARVKQRDTMMSKAA